MRAGASRAGRRVKRFGSAETLHRRNSLPAMGLKSGAPARREPGGDACAAFAEAVKAVAARPRES